MKNRVELAVIRRCSETRGLLKDALAAMAHNLQANAEPDPEKVAAWVGLSTLHWLWGGAVENVVGADDPAQALRDFRDSLNLSEPGEDADPIKRAFHQLGCAVYGDWLDSVAAILDSSASERAKP